MSRDQKLSAHYPAELGLKLNYPFGNGTTTPSFQRIIQQN